MIRRGSGNQAAVRCTLYPGAFSCERVYEFAAADGSTVQGVDQTLRLWHADGRQLREEDPTPSGGMPGLLAVRVLLWPDDYVVVGFWDIMDWVRAAVGPDVVVDRPDEVVIENEDCRTWVI